MSCFFSHKFGKIEPDGYQYCQKCGEARIPSKPHPCQNGHFWKEASRLGYSGVNFASEWRDWKVSYFCDVCGEQKVEWLYGH